MTRVRIENATHLVTVNSTDEVLTDATITVDDGVITEITTGPRAHGRLTTRPSSTPAASW